MNISFLRKLYSKMQFKKVSFAMLKSESLHLRKMTINYYKMVFELWINVEGMGLRSLDDSKEGINALLKCNPNTCFVALDSKKVIGAILCGHDGRYGYIYHTVVCSEYRKQGIETALVTTATADLKNEGITLVCLNVMYNL